jgi:hypothetical protein
MSHDFIQFDGAAGQELNSSECLFLADIVAKRFSAPERETMIQNRAPTRNFDSTTRPSRFEYCANLLSGCDAGTFATISAVGHSSRRG